MRVRGAKLKLGSENELSTQLDLRRAAYRDDIAQMTESYLMQVNEDDLVAHLVEKYQLDPPVLDVDQRSVEIEEREIPAEHFPMGWNVRSGQTYPRQVAIFAIPCSGSINLIGTRASTLNMGYNPEIVVGNDFIAVEVLSLSESQNEINQTFAETMQAVTAQVSYVKRDLDQFNAALPRNIRDEVVARKNRFIAKNALLDGLNAPIKIRPGAADSFTVPVLKPKETIIPKPQAASSHYRPTPALDEAIYRNIVAFLHQAGVRLERLPSTYAGKDEESIRDFLLTMLDSQFEGAASATGETFNKTGKTDILVNYQGGNVFAAECKFWKGSKAFGETIDQLLGYLTWRDNKAALIIFDRNVGFSKDLESIQLAIESHPNYLKTLDGAGASKSTHQFHLGQDRGMLVTLSVLVFHFPTNPKVLADLEKQKWLKDRLEMHRLTDNDRLSVCGSAGSIAAIPDLARGLGQKPHLVDELEKFHQFALDNELGEIFEQICAVEGTVQGVRVELKRA